nr:hypothetical protein [Staphylococcus aureus]
MVVTYKCLSKTFIDLLIPPFSSRNKYE